jgi:hypothetical protein
MTAERHKARYRYFRTPINQTNIGEQIVRCFIFPLTANQQRKIAMMLTCNFTSVAEPHHFYAAPAPGKNFDAAPAAPTLLNSKAKFLK